MGVIVTYRLRFPEARVTVSNDVDAEPPLGFSVFLVDAEVKAEMLRGPLGGAFECRLYDLPIDAARRLQARLLAPGQRLTAEIRLGYFDGGHETVMEGVVEKLQSEVDEGKLVTTVKGAEKATYALRNTGFADYREEPRAGATLASAVERLVGAAARKFTPGLVSAVPDLAGLDRTRRLAGTTYGRGTALAVLGSLAEEAGAELLVADGKVQMGSIADPRRVPEFAGDLNLASFRPFVSEIPDPAAADLLAPIRTLRATGFEFTVSGDPGLRSGQRVSAAVEDFGRAGGSEFRIHSLTHELTRAGGYYCRGVAMKHESGARAASLERNAARPGAEAVARTLSARIAAPAVPVLEVGSLKRHRAGEHRCDLYFGQSPARGETQPSVRTPVAREETQVYLDKPPVSPFAWHKCGLVVPVYPGMKALLGHHRALQDDVVVTGFLWSQEPAITPPAGAAGDWWLCLPVDFDTTRPPQDSTKAANDLTAVSGKRVIEAKGLKITIGAGRLPNVGVRPAEGADDELLIEHASGTRLRIAADGTLTLEAEQIEVTGDVKITGTLEVV